MFRILLVLMVFVGSGAIAVEDVNKSPPVPGKLIFAQIKQLPEKWWKNPDTVWGVWDKNTYYLWGANLKNYKIFDPDKSLKGSGMASSDKGPTRGRGHPHYIGVITTSLSFKQNDLVFEFLEKKLKEGSNIVVPVMDGRYSLGTGVAIRRHSSKKDWYRSQKYLFEKLIRLFPIANEVVFTEQTTWPDCADSSGKFTIRGVEDIRKILPYLDWKIN